MSPFHNLDQRCGGPVPTESTGSLPSLGRTPVVGGRPGANTKAGVISLPRFVRLLSLGVLGVSPRHRTVR
jgi:hypothetical protein